jgi:hypothetical protein
MTAIPGVIINQGASDWQIFQQNESGYAEVKLQGSWTKNEDYKNPTVQVHVVDQNTNVAVDESLFWQNARTSADGSWDIELHIPAGGLYRIETRLNANPGENDEWSPRGDMRFFVGVGDLWVIAGQSNSAGYGRGPVQDPPEPGVHVFRSSEEWMMAAHPLNESTNTRHTENMEGCNPGHSPYIHFARLLKKELGYPIGLIPTALGGSPLCGWTPLEEEGPALYENMLHCIQQAGGKIKGVLWYQGCSDCWGDNALNYAQRFADAVHSWRSALLHPELPVITVQLNKVYQPSDPEADKGWSLVREAQRQAPHMIDNVYVVPALNLPLSDLIHNSPAGNMLLADYLAHAALGGVYGKNISFRAPEILSATANSEKTYVILSFENVTTQIFTVDVTAIPFRIVDEDGIVPISNVEYPRDHTIRIHTERALAGKAFVDGAWGANPPIVPMDNERFLPMLGFSGVQIEEVR